MALSGTWHPDPIPGYWQICFVPPLAGSLGITDPARWEVLHGLVWDTATSAIVVAPGHVRIAGPGWGGTATHVRYLGPPPPLQTSEGYVLPAFDHVIPF